MLINYARLWSEIVHASGLQDEVLSVFTHDLLDGVADNPTAPLDYAWRVLCQRTQAKTAQDFERILDRFRVIDGLEKLRLPDRMIEAAIVEPSPARQIGIPDHTSADRGTYSSRWGTPAWLIDWFRKHYGPITYDLASSAEANLVVQAKRFWSEQDPCPAAPRCMPIGGTLGIWCNPPGPRREVEFFWDAWQDACSHGARGGFLIFKQDHWRALARPAFPTWAVVLRKRLAFIRSAEEARALAEQGKNPTGASFPSTLILTQEPDVPRDAMAELGHVLEWRP